METTIEEAGPFERVVTVHIENEALESAKDEAARRLSKDLTIKGFRPGKAPRRVVEATVGEDKLRSEAIDVALPDVVGEALTDADIRPATTPAVQDLRDTDNGVEVDVKVTLWPELDRPPIYEGRRVSVSAPEVAEDEIDEQVDRLRDQFSELEDVSRPITDGDFAVINLSASVNGQAIEDLTASDLTYPVGSGSFVPGLDDHLVGESSGAIVKYNDTLPEGYGEYGGTEVTLQVLVKTVRQKKLPELTDEWVDEVSEFETIEALQEELRGGLYQHKLAAARREFSDKVLEELLDDMDLELPEGLVSAELEFQVHRFLHRLEEQGIGLADYLRVTGLDEQGFLAEARSQAERALGVRILLDAVAKAEGIDVTDEELETAVATLAQSSEEPPEEYEKSLRESGQVDVLTGDILRSKVIDRLVEAAVPVDENGNELSLQEDAVDASDDVDTESQDTEENNGDEE